MGDDSTWLYADAQVCHGVIDMATSIVSISIFRFCFFDFSVKIKKKKLSVTFSVLELN